MNGKKSGFVMLLGLTLCLSACSNSRTIVQRNADHLALQMADQNFSASFRTQVPDTAKSLSNFLQPFYDEGKKMRAAGVTEDQALAIAALLRKRGLESPLASQETFAGKTYTSGQSEASKKLVAQAMVNTFIAGYNGTQ